MIALCPGANSAFISATGVSHPGPLASPQDAFILYHPYILTTWFKREKFLPTLLSYASRLLCFIFVKDSVKFSPTLEHIIKLLRGLCSPTCTLLFA